MAAESGNTPSALRPGNPTPAHADGKGSPAPVRPQHPTPAHAVQTIQERPGKFTVEYPSPGSVYIYIYDTSHPGLPCLHFKSPSDLMFNKASGEKS